MKKNKIMAFKTGRYAGFTRPFIVLTPDEDKLLGHAAIDQELTKSEFLKRCFLYVIKHKIKLNEPDK